MRAILVLIDHRPCSCASRAPGLMSTATTPPPRYVALLAREQRIGMSLFFMHRQECMRCHGRSRWPLLLLRALRAGDLQWWGVSYIPLADGSTAYLFNGRRWLSGPNVPSGCDDICGNNDNPAACGKCCLGERWVSESHTRVSCRICSVRLVLLSFRL